MTKIGHRVVIGHPLPNLHTPRADPYDKVRLR
jgi:hypothetical protein